ncbi:MAG: HEPN domain-containing protein [Nitrososphaeria archaeon]|nr:HEPN domain-containing protein [Nitrososphaeria archaeon]
MYERWLKKALNFEAEALDNLNSGRYDLACFSAQQSSEMRLKGLLIKLAGSRPYTHLLSEMLEIIRSICNIEITDEVIECARKLEEHYLQARYPDARLSEYTRREAEEALKCMEVIKKFVENVVQETG